MKLKVISNGIDTKLIDEDTGEMVHGVSKLTYAADAHDPVVKVNIEFFNIPVEIISKADVQLYEYDMNTAALQHTKTFEKNIKVVSPLSGITVLSSDTKVFDADTNEQIGAVQKVEWEATPLEAKATVQRVKFDNRDW